jgi:hypothetical protein
MRQRLAIILFVAIILTALVALNAISYTPVEQEADKEASPRRSTFNAGASGTKALFDFLAESGYSVTRWRDPVEQLDDARGAKLEKPHTLIVVGSTILPFKPEEGRSVLSWVAKGNRLVLIDRDSSTPLIRNGGDWLVSLSRGAYPSFNEQSGNVQEMIAGADPVQPVQPTSFVREVERVQPSRFAGLISIVPSVKKAKAATKGHSDAVGEGDEDEDSATIDENPPPPARNDPPPAKVKAPQGGFGVRVPEIDAPVLHLANKKGALLADYTYGAGRVVVLSDPFIVSNAGISLADNLQLAVNVITAESGLIAFDEFHQGYGANENQIAAYFRKTPILALCGQLCLVVILLVWSSGVRFGRALPLPYIDRRSNLEFVSSMAELQRRARAYDLAVENIYTRFRRVLVRFAGTSAALPRAEVARRVAERSGLQSEGIEAVMRDAEAVINGEPIDDKQTVDLIRRMRALERELGLGTRSRDVRQAEQL